MEGVIWDFQSRLCGGSRGILVLFLLLRLWLCGGTGGGADLARFVDPRE